MLEVVFEVVLDVVLLGPAKETTEAAVLGPRAAAAAASKTRGGDTMSDITELRGRFLSEN